MPSKESLEQGVLIRCHDCGGTLLYKETEEGYEVFHSCKDGKQVREILDEAIRAEAEKAIQIAASYGHEITSPFCEEKVAVADCMMGAAKFIENALRMRLAQLREGKT